MHFKAICCDISQNSIGVICFLTDKASIYKHVQQVYPTEKWLHTYANNKKYLKQLIKFLSDGETGETTVWRCCFPLQSEGRCRMMSLVLSTWSCSCIPCHCTGKMPFVTLGRAVIFCSLSLIFFECISSWFTFRKATVSKNHLKAPFKLTITEVSSNNALISEVNKEVTVMISSVLCMLWST